MRLFYITLGLLWIVAAGYFYFNNPTETLVLPVAYFVIGAAMEIMAYYNKVIYVGKYVSMSNERLEIFLSPVKQISLKWEEIQSIRIGKKMIELKTTDSMTKRLDLSKLDDRQWKTVDSKIVKTVQEKHIEIL